MDTEIQKRIAEFVGRYGLTAPAPYRVLDLASEVGELSKEILKATNYGEREFRPSEGWEEELGDVLVSLICVANSTEVDLEQALLKVLGKYRECIESRQDAGSGRS
jgi:NTP pyrophosphatase (non-canonical NTP hydrolase)